MVSVEQLQNRAHVNYNRTRANFIAAAGRKINAEHNLLRKYHLPYHPNSRALNALLKNVRNERVQRAQANYNRARANFIAAAGRKVNADKNLSRKYHLPYHPRSPTLNPILKSLVRNEKARIRHRARTRVLSAVLLPNVANRIARSMN